MKNKRELTWQSTEARILELCRPCECGCDFRDGVKGVGYLIGSGSDGKGITVWIEDEETYQRLQVILEEQRPVTH